MEEVRPPTLRQQRLMRAYRAMYADRRPTSIFPQSQKVRLYDVCAEQLGATLQTYLEFGVFKGWSMGQMLQRFTNPAARFFGFDSFEGLPEMWTQKMGVGYFSTGGQAPKFNDPRVAFVRGWFQDTVSGFLKEKAPFNGPVLVHFDADLYSSTLFLLSSLWHFIPEYHFYFDDFLGDELIALHDFAAAYPVDIEFFAAVEIDQERPLQVYGRLRNAKAGPRSEQ